MTIDPTWLEPTWFIDSDSDAVTQFASDAIGDETTALGIARALFYAVRDGIRYDPYSIQHNRVAFRASTVAQSSRNWCTPKAILLTAAARNRGIPACLGFADVRNHLTSAKLSDAMGTDLFVWHGFSVLFLDDRPVKLSTAFNVELCERFGVKVLEFDAVNGALMHPFDESGQRHMEYVHDRGVYADLPMEEMFATFREVYPNWTLANRTDSLTNTPGDEDRDTTFDPK